MTHDLIIRNASLRNGSRADITIDGSSFAEIGESISGDARQEIDAGGNLVTESYVVGQLHLDKVFTGPWVDFSATSNYTTSDMGGAMTAIELAAAVKARYTVEDVAERAEQALIEAERAGVSHMRAFVDVDTKAKLVGLEGVMRARERLAGRVDVQIVSFPQDGVLRDPGAAELVEEGVRMGADVVGGIPWLEYTEDGMRRHVDLMFDIAVRYDKPISMLVDDAGDPGLRTIEYLAQQTIERGWQGRVSACHARAMSTYNEAHHRRVVALLQQAQMGIVTNPH